MSADDHERDGSLGPKYLDNIKDAIDLAQSLKPDVPALKVWPRVMDSVVELSNRKVSLLEMLDDHLYEKRAELERKRIEDERIRRRDQMRGWTALLLAFPAAVWALILFAQWWFGSK